MKRCYRFHPGEYAIGENEQFYGRMAQRGWLLDKRGAYLSRFPQRRAAAAKIQNRIVLTAFS